MTDDISNQHQLSVISLSLAALACQPSQPLAHAAPVAYAQTSFNPISANDKVPFL